MNIRNISENEQLVNDYYKQNFRVAYFKNPYVTIINGKKYWTHDVELAEMIKKLKAETKNKKELDEINELVDSISQTRKSLRELL